MKMAIIFGVVMLVFVLRYHALSVDYKEEQAAHIQTQAALAAALAEGQRWQTVAGETLTAAESQKQLAMACLARESEARADEEARKAILTSAKPRPRTETEQQQVVDDETRLRAVTRLNRGL